MNSKKQSIIRNELKLLWYKKGAGEIRAGYAA